MITPQQQQQIDQLTKGTNFAKPVAQNNTWSGFDQLTSANKPQNATTPITNMPDNPDHQEAIDLINGKIDTGKQGVLHNLGSSVVDATKKIGGEFKDAFNDSVDTTADAMNGKINPFPAGMKIAANFMDPLLVKPTNEVMNATGIGKLSQGVFHGLDHVVDFLTGKPQGTTTANGEKMSAEAEQTYNAWKEAHPDAANALEAMGTATQAGMNVAGAEQIGSSIKDAVPTILDNAKTGAGKVGDMATNAGNKIAETASNLSNKFKFKTPASDIVADPTQSKYYKGNIDAWNKPVNTPTATFNAATKVATKATASGNDVGETLTKLGISPESTITDGRYDTTEVSQGIREDTGKLSSDLLRPSLKQADLSTPKTPVQDVIDSAKQNITSDKSLTAGNKARLLKNIDAEGAALTKANPDGLGLENMLDNKITYDKNAGYSPVNDIATNLEATKNKALADAFRSTLEAKAPPDINIPEFNAELQKQYQAADYLDALNNKKAPITRGQATLKTGAKILGAKVGSTFGGGILGGVAGYHIGGMIDDLFTNMPSAARETFLRNLQVSNPEAFQAVSDYMGKEQAAQMTRLKLPEPGQSTSPINLPGDTQVPMGTEEVANMKRSTIGEGNQTLKESSLIKEATNYKSAEEFIKAQPTAYHGSPVELKQFHNKSGAFFTDSMEDASGFGGNTDNVYEGVLNFKKPLVIDANGAKWDNLNTKYGKSTQEVISNAQKDGYDGVVFKNIVDNVMDTEGEGGQSTISYAYKPKDVFLNESQLTDIWKKAHGK